MADSVLIFKEPRTAIVFHGTETHARFSGVETTVEFQTNVEILDIQYGGPQGPRGLGVILLEPTDTAPPPETPVGTIIYRKVV